MYPVVTAIGRGAAMQVICIVSDRDCSLRSVLSYQNV